MLTEYPFYVMSRDRFAKKKQNNYYVGDYIHKHQYMHTYTHRAIAQSSLFYTVYAVYMQIRQILSLS